MWNQRDRMLAGMFAVQLAAAIVFGLLVADNLSQGGGAVPVVAGDVATSTAGGSDLDGDGLADAAPADGAVVDGGSGDVATGGGGTVAEGSAGGQDTTGTGGRAGPVAPADDADAAAGEEPAATTGGPGTRTGVTDDSVRIGVLVTQTGAINFRSSAQATKAYVDMVNEQGGVNGRRIEVLLRDDGLDQNRGQQAVQEMLNAGVFSFVAFNAPLTEQSVLPVLEKNNIPMIGAFAIPAHPLGYMFSAPYETYGKVGGFTVCDQQPSKAGLIYISNQNADTDRTIVESWRAGLDKCGLTLADDDVYGVDVTKASFDDVVTSLRFSGVDAIGTILDATAMVRLQQSMNRAAYTPVHVSSPFGGDPAVLQNPNVGASFEGTLVLSDVEFLGSSSASVQTYEQQVRRRFGGQAEVNWAGEHGWLGTHIFVEALRRLGDDPTRERLIETMNSLQDLRTGFTVPLTVTADPASHASNNSCMKVGKVVNGKVQQLRDWQCPPLENIGGGTP